MGAKYTKHDQQPYSWQERGSACSEDGCGKTVKARGLCGTHYARWFRHGNVTDKRSRGKQCVNAEGYRFVRVNGQQRLEHRVIMERVVGRPLLKHEVVHHKNGNKVDNRPENLELWSTMQPKGQRVEDKLAYADEIIALYGPEYGVNCHC